MCKILKISAREILDSRGEWTVEATVVIEGGNLGVASVPIGESRGENEAAVLPAVEAVKKIKEVIAPTFIGEGVGAIANFDHRLDDLDRTKRKSNLGGNTLLAVSMAYARAYASWQKRELWQLLRESYGGSGALKPPRLLMNMFEGGLHAGGNINFQEYWVVPKLASVGKMVEVGRKFYQKLGETLVREKGASAANVGHEGGFAGNLEDDLEPLRIFSRVAAELNLTDRVDFGLDAAASNVRLPADKLTALYREMATHFSLAYLEDPFGEEEFNKFTELKKYFGRRPVIMGDDLTVTNPERIERAAREGSIGGVIIKPNQIGTVSGALAAVRAARQNNLEVYVSHRGQETNDTFIADLAVAVSADGIKLGAPQRGERVAKFNRLLKIFDSLI